MKTIILSSILAILLLSSLTSAALGIGFPGEINQEKDTEVENMLTLFTFGDKNDQAIITVKQGQDCVSFPEGTTVNFGGKDMAYKKIITKTTNDCNEAEIKIQLSPVTSVTSSGTVGMNLAVVKSFVIKSVSSTSTVAIIAITGLVLAVLLLVAAMIKVAKKRN